MVSGREMKERGGMRTERERNGEKEGREERGKMEECKLMELSLSISLIHLLGSVYFTTSFRL